MPTPVPTKRLLSNWIASYHEYTQNTESPDMFHMWTALWALAGALQRKVWFPYLTRNIYPNLYVVLVAPPGTARKGAALGIGKSLLGGTGVPMVASSITGPALVQYASEAMQSYERPDPLHPNDPAEAITEIHNSLSLCSDEFATFFGSNKDNTQTLDILTDWFDCPAPWEHRTKTQGVDRIEAVWFNLLAATTPDSIATFLPKAAIGGGFSSRALWVYEDQSRPRIAFPFLDERLGAALLNDLIYITHHIRGPVRFSPEAHKWYCDWYEKGNWDAGVEAPEIKYYLTRKPAHVIRVAMVCHFAYSDTMVLEVNDLKMALRAIERLEPQMAKVFRTSGLNKYSDVQDRVYAYIQRQAPQVKFNVVPESQLLDVFSADLDLRSLQMVTETLCRGGRLRRMTHNGTIGYMLKEDPLPTAKPQPTTAPANAVDQKEPTPDA